MREPADRKPREASLIISWIMSVWLAQLVKSLYSCACSLMRVILEVRGSTPGADELDSGFHPFGVDTISSN